MAKYSIGVDYGTLSGRAVLLNIETGELVAQAEGWERIGHSSTL